MWGLSVKLPCQIHDHRYENGSTPEEKRAADCELLHNCYILIENAEKPHLEVLRKNRAEAYYEAVRFGGEGAFGKNNAKFA